MKLIKVCQPTRFQQSESCSVETDVYEQINDREKRDSECVWRSANTTPSQQVCLLLQRSVLEAYQPSFCRQNICCGLAETKRTIALALRRV